MPAKYSKPEELTRLSFTELCPGYFYRGESKILERRRVPDGFGEMEYREVGSRYIGYWKNGDFDGFGTLDEINRISYTGYFKKSSKHGSGEQRTADGSIFKGNWDNGRLLYPFIRIDNGVERIIERPEVNPLPMNLSRFERERIRLTMGALPRPLQEMLNAEESTRASIESLERSERRISDEAYAQIQQLSLIEEERNQAIAALMAVETSHRKVIFEQEQRSYLSFFESQKINHSAALKAAQSRLVRTAAMLMEQKEQALQQIEHDFDAESKILTEDMISSLADAQENEDLRKFRESLHLDREFTFLSGPAPMGTHGAIGEDIELNGQKLN